MKGTNIPKEKLHTIFNYEDGKLINKLQRKGCTKLGKAAGCLDKSTGYSRVMVNGTNYRCHRVIWNWHFGDIPNDMIVDHINGDKSDNRIENLRLLTQSLNLLYGFARKRGEVLDGMYDLIHA
jgi:hypothetical protein